MGAATRGDNCIANQRVAWRVRFRSTALLYDSNHVRALALPVSINGAKPLKLEAF